MSQTTELIYQIHNNIPTVPGDLAEVPMEKSGLWESIKMAMVSPRFKYTPNILDNMGTDQIPLYPLFSNSFLGTHL